MSQSPSTFIEAFKTVSLSAVLALGIRQFVAEARYIPSESMLPTLEINDRLMIEKISYRFRPPERGDIVVFNPTTKLEEQDFHDAFIKRVIGLPGEEVAVEAGEVYIDGQPLNEDYIEPEGLTEVGPCIVQHEEPFLVEPVVIPDNAYLVLGDNRPNSYDSRCWGIVPESKIIGRAAVRFWPLGRIGGVERPDAE
ncbi:MAG: signal peptidase I [Spirulinaceae cyanobacterium]